MIPILYAPTATVFNTNGLGGLSDCISCVVTEERNGQYTLEMIYPIDGVHFEDISYSSIIKAIPSDGTTAQLFRVYKISKPLNGKVTIEADHISYQLSFIPVAPFTAGTCAAALEGLVTNSLESNPFTVWTDKTTSASYTQGLPASFRSRLGGTQGSILDVYGGEYEFDNYIVKLHANRGADNGVTLRYGKNITDIKQEENISNTVTGIVPYWSNNNTTVTGDAQYADNAGNYPFKRTIVKDFSQDIEEAPTKAELEAYTRAYITRNNIGVPLVNIDVSFIALWQTEEYQDLANLERVKLCDTITVDFEKLGISAKAKVIKTEYDVLKERYLHIEVGEARSTLATTINNIEKKTEESIDYSDLTNAINRATELLRGGLGGYVVLNTNADGKPNEILIMDTADINTAVNVIRMNMNGIGFSTTGYNGTYTNAWTIDGALNADFITTGSLSANRINGGTLTLGGNNNGNGTMSVKDSNNNVIGTWDKDGITVKGGSISGTKLEWGGENENVEMSWKELAGYYVLQIINNTGSPVEIESRTDANNYGFMQIDEGYISMNSCISGVNRGIYFTTSGISLNASEVSAQGYHLARDVTAQNVNIGIFESGGKKYLGIYKGTTAYGNVQLT